MAMLEAALGGRGAVIQAYENEQPIVAAGGGGLGLKTYSYTDAYELPQPSSGTEAPWAPFEIDPVPAGKIFIPVISAEFFTPTITEANQTQPGQIGALVQTMLRIEVTRTSGPGNVDPAIEPLGGPLLGSNTQRDAGGNPVCAPDQWWYETPGFGLAMYWAPGDLDIHLTTSVADTQQGAYVSGCKIRNLELTMVTFE